jgi:hypothetical protein
VGNANSGNWGERSRYAKTTDMRALDARRLKRHGQLEPGFRGHIVWRWADTGEETARVFWDVDATGARLAYKHRDRSRGEDWQDAEYRVPILRTPCHLGGERAWFGCPCCGKRVAILYGGHPFACRSCHRLTYKSQRVGRSERASDMAHDLRHRLGWSPGLTGPEVWNRPKGMHHATFARHVARYEELELASWADWIGRFDLPDGADLNDILRAVG